MLRNPASIPERRWRCACGHNHDVAPEICGSRPPRFSLLPKEILAMRHFLNPPISTAPTLLPRLHFFHYSILFANIANKKERVRSAPSYIVYLYDG